MLIIRVKIILRAKRNEIVEKKKDFLKIKLAAVPEKGKANQELIKFLARTFKVPKSAVKIIKGERRRVKFIQIFNS